MDALLVAFVLFREVVALIAVGVALCCFDDLIIDAIYFLCAFRHARSDTTRLTSDELGRDDPDPIAIFVPAWDEAAVIGAMLTDLTSRLDYSRYHVFVGVYPNDPATLAAVRSVQDPRIDIAVNPKPGSTTKGDCLNVLWRALHAHEAARGIHFKAVVLHDAEDVVHPHELRVFNHLIPRLDMVQLPVHPLPDPESRWISGHYLDEFAEHHGKTLLVRQALGAGVPSAGVACAFARGMLERIAAANGGMPFDAACVTEDYELGLLIHALGGRGALVHIRGAHGCVATREHFPSELPRAIRQKTRWLLGIALQGWDRLGWRGGLAERYLLLRDRKAIFAAILTMLAYLSMAGLIAAAAIRAFYPPAHAFSPIVAPGGPLAMILAFNLIALSWRLLMRATFTGRIYGRAEALYSIPRAVVGNVINFLAALRATDQYLRLALGYQRLVWEKTAHRFPTLPAG